MHSGNTGKVWLIGAGPGDPGLLTLRGRECLAMAEVVVYDNLIHPALLRYSPGAELVYVGKQSGRHSLPQEDINRILVAQAGAGRRVARLKGGDPFVFGRGGEEALALRAAGIPFEVVPGVTSGIAAPACAGIPVTHRGLSGSVTFLTAHDFEESRGGRQLSSLALEGTLVFYMGSLHCAEICRTLVNSGRSAATPAAVVEWGTWMRQRTATGTLSDIAEKSAAAGLGAPSLLVVGQVAALREELAWFESRPLFGIRVALTHTEAREGELERQFQAAGAEVLTFPVTENEPLPGAAEKIDWRGHDWILLTSVNAVRFLFDAMDAAGGDARLLAGSLLAVAGQATREAAAARYLKPDALPVGYSPQAIVGAMDARRPLRGARVLLPGAEYARTAIPPALRAMGAEVTEVAAYRSRPLSPEGGRVTALLTFSPDVVVFSNAKAATGLSGMLDSDQLGRVRGRALFAAMGPVTARAVRECFDVEALAPEQHTVAGLVEAVCAWRADISGI